MRRVETGTTGADGVRIFREMVAGGSAAPAYNRSALNLYLAGKVEESRREFERALAVNPSDVYVLNNLGHLLLARSKPSRDMRWGTTTWGMHISI
jgi:tetratricopeptide (TPR) repeat protein